MSANRRPRASRALLALVFGLALLAPGGAGRGTAGTDPAASPAATATAGTQQDHLRDVPGRSPVAPAGKRQDRDPPGPSLLWVLAAAAAAAPAWTVVGRRADRPARRRSAAAAGPRAPPSLQPTPI